MYYNFITRFNINNEKERCYLKIRLSLLSLLITINYPTIMFTDEFHFFELSQYAGVADNCILRIIRMFKNCRYICIKTFNTILHSIIVLLLCIYFIIWCMSAFGKKTLINRWLVYKAYIYNHMHYSLHLSISIAEVEILFNIIIV